MGKAEGRLDASICLRLTAAGGLVTSLADLPGCRGKHAPPGTDYGARFFSWLNATLPAAPPGVHRCTNAAKPAHTSATFALCAGALVPQDADLVVLEASRAGAPLLGGCAGAASMLPRHSC